MSELLDFLKKANEDFAQTLEDIDKTKRVLNYWSEDNAETRKQNERIISYYNKKSDAVLINSLIMWICMIVVTIACWFCYDIIIDFCGINNKIAGFFVMLGIYATINLIIAIVLHIFRH